MNGFLSSTIQSVTITGVDGFVGRHLAVQAKRRGLRVVGVARAALLPTDLDEFVDDYYSVDLTESFPVSALSESVIHLAGLANVGASFRDPQMYLTGNSQMVTNLFETILGSQSEDKTRVLIVSSGAVYGPSKPGIPISEDDAISFSSPYAVSKVLVENQVDYYRSRGVSALVARPFNHIGPGQKAGFIVPDLWEQISRLTDGDDLSVGNLDTSRDYTDVRDVAGAYLDLIVRSDLKTGTFNVCSGVSTTGNEILAILCAEMGIKVPSVREDRDKFRPLDVSVIVGSNNKLRKDLGWIPQISIRNSIRDFVKAKSNLSS